MSTIEQKRKNLDLMRVQTAKYELELKIEERLEEIERLKAHIAVQTEAETKIKAELESSKG